MGNVREDLSMAVSVPSEILGLLREAIVGLGKSSAYKEIVEPREEVLSRFQPVFLADHIPEMSDTEFRSFLLLENNHHWSGLHRSGSRMTADMHSLRSALTILVDETQHLSERLTEVTDMISGMGKNVATAILLVTQPEKYGVWNNRSEANMKRFGIWPGFDRGESFGNRYEKVNQILLQLRHALGIDLWTLDALWWYLDQEGGDSPPGEGDQQRQQFGLERHLHDFMRDNWEQIDLSSEWTLYQEPGDREAGYEYPTDVGRIDLLAKHKRKPWWLVIELKRNQTSDQTVGQLLRYIGWVRKHLAEKGDQVHGLIVCREADDALRYALIPTNNIQLKLYEVEFHLREP